MSKVEVKQDPFGKVLSGPVANSSRDDMLIQRGLHTDSTITLSANNTTAQENIFQINGSVQILELRGIVTDATTLTNCTGVYVDLWDGTVSTEITDSATGATISGFNVGGILLKDTSSANAISVVNNDQGNVREASGAQAYYNFHVVQKLSTNTYIRMVYTTTDTPINAQIEWHCIWKPGPDDTGSVIPA